MEILAGVAPERQAGIREMLGRFRKLPITDAIAEQAVVERRDRKIKLPDAVLMATATLRGGRLINPQYKRLSQERETPSDPVLSYTAIDFCQRPAGGRA